MFALRCILLQKCSCLLYKLSSRLLIHTVIAVILLGSIHATPKLTPLLIPLRLAKPKTKSNQQPTTNNQQLDSLSRSPAPRPNSDINDLHQNSKSHCKVNIAFGNMKIYTFCYQSHTYHHQKGQG
jgi:hypothetical protein